MLSLWYGPAPTVGHQRIKAVVSEEGEEGERREGRRRKRGRRRRESLPFKLSQAGRSPAALPLGQLPHEASPQPLPPAKEPQTPPTRALRVPGLAGPPTPGPLGL